MKKIFILLFIIPLLLCKLEQKSKDEKSFFELLNSHSNKEDTKCTTTPDSSGQCAYAYFEQEEEEEIFYSRFNHCPDQQYCLDIIVPEYSYKCKPMPKFYGEPCKTDDDCATNKCVDSLCTRKNTGDYCRNDKECGLADYCHYTEEHEESTLGICTPYITTEGADCNYNDLCHPQYECDYDENKCKVRGKKGLNEPADKDYECASFMVEDGECSDKYDLTTRYGLECEKKAKAFKNINWSDKDLKVSDYYGYNFGSKLNLELNKEFEFQRCVKEYGKAYCDCQDKISNENYVAHILWDSYQKDDSLPDDLIKEILQNSHSNFIKLGLILVISLLALI